MTHRDLVADVVLEDQQESQAQRWDAEWWWMWLLSENIMLVYSVQPNSHNNCDFWMLSHICACENRPLLLFCMKFHSHSLLWHFGLSWQLFPVFFFFLPPLLRAPRAMMDLPALQERGLVSDHFWSVPPEMLRFCALCSTRLEYLINTSYGHLSNQN